MIATRVIRRDDLPELAVARLPVPSARPKEATMAQVKFDTRFIHAPAVAMLSDRAFRLHIAGICWSSRYSTAAVIPRKGMTQISGIRQATKAAAELVAAGLWREQEDGDFLITHDAFTVERDPSYAPGQRERIYARDGHQCVECGVTDDLTLDHIHPRARAGGDGDDNLRTLCRPCNSRKGARV